VQRLRIEGTPAVFGDAATPEVLIQAHIARARMLVIATSQSLGVPQMVSIARTLNPEIEVVIRSHNPDEAALLEREALGRVFLGEQELASAMTHHVLARFGGPAA
jgi:CPA2 family monovalent cation:H+ antiporter-2